MVMELVATKMCMTKDIGVHGNMFGGLMLCLLDEAGAILASQVTGSESLVTVKIEEVEFKKPVKTGQIIRVYGEVVQIGRSSIKLLLEAKSLNVKSDIEKLVCCTNITFVRIDKDGEPMPIAQHIRDKYKDVAK